MSSGYHMEPAGSDVQRATICSMAREARWRRLGSLRKESHRFRMVSPELHRRAAMKAEARKQSLNSLVVEAMEAALKG